MLPILYCATLFSAEPRVLDDRMRLELVAKEPDIVTPVGLTFDHKGRLLVIESHTHFPKADYSGQKHDRIRLFKDTNGDGTLDGISNFLEGTSKTMSVAAGPDGWIYVATRMRIFRTRDTDGDDKADKEQEIAILETAGDYPHNGLCGLCFDENRGLYFGLGENLGRDYTLFGSDGAKLPGGGEGGNIYHCRLDGSGLQLVATGFWNPFGICVDPYGRVFTVGNDPDASPPCRLVHVVQGGDYGYQFRYGRSGKHPLQAWNGELPGTLPMVAGTSEAPSAVVPFDGQLWVTSWGEYRIERFELIPRGASFGAKREIVVEGGDDFRPVDFAVAPDGSLYFTDWVDRSYNVHGKGRVWRLSWKVGGKRVIGTFPKLTAAEIAAARAAESPDPDALDSSNPFLHNAAIEGYKNNRMVVSGKLADVSSARQKLGLLQAARRSTRLMPTQRDKLLKEALGEGDAHLKTYALRWIADDKLQQFGSDIDQLLSADISSAQLFRAAIAARDWLQTGKVERNKLVGEEFLVRAAKEHASPSIQAMALRVLPSGHAALETVFLSSLAQDRATHIAVRREAVRSLALSTDPKRFAALTSILTTRGNPEPIRADAIGGLDITNAPGRETIESLKTDPSKVVRSAVSRAIARRTPIAKQRPNPESIDDWLGLIGDGGDSEAGWRIFFGRHAARCANCHRLNGRGADIGPDLTGIAKRMGRRRVLESILVPSKEVAPQFVPWIVQMKSGRVFSGMSLGVPGSGPVEQFLGTDGKHFDIQRGEIETRTLSKNSVMPNDLLKYLSADDLRDLLALMTSDD